MDKELENIFNLSPDMIGRGSLEGHFTKTNPAFEQILGYSEDEFLNKPFLSFVHIDDIEQTEQALKNANNGQKNIAITNRYRCRDDSYKWIEWRVNVSSEDKKFYAVGRDITDKKQAENLSNQKILLEQIVSDRTRELKEAIELAESANRTKSLFLANMSHEIRTPLNGVISLTQLLSRKNINSEQSEIVKKLRLSAKILQQLIDDVLDLAKIEAGKFNLENTNYSPIQLVNECLMANEEQATKKRLQLATNISQNVPEILFGDSKHLSQVLFNLVSNAIKFTTSGIISIKLDSRESTKKEVLLLLSVMDTGIGISKDDQQTIFSKFIQSDNSTSRQYGGFGLGLSICKQLVDLMGGRIKVQSSPGEGSNFICEIPMKKVIKAEIPIKHKNINNFHNGMNVLVVDDDHINRFAVKGLLESEGVQVVLAESGKEALKIAEKEAFDMILMDLHMPDLNGWDTTRIFRASPLTQLSSVPIIGLTADVLKESRDFCFEVGMNAVVSKPFKFTDLLAQIQTLTELPK